MKITQLENVKVFQIEHEEDGYIDVVDVFVPDITDMSSIVCIMKNGDFLPFDEWDKYETILRNHIN
jgi:hypothetical protein